MKHVKLPHRAQRRSWESYYIMEEISRNISYRFWLFLMKLTLNIQKKYCSSWSLQTPCGMWCNHNTRKSFIWLGWADCSFNFCSKVNQSNFKIPYRSVNLHYSLNLREIPYSIISKYRERMLKTNSSSFNTPKHLQTSEQILWKSQSFCWNLLVTAAGKTDS